MPWEEKWALGVPALPELTTVRGGTSHFQNHHTFKCLVDMQKLAWIIEMFLCK